MGMDFDILNEEIKSKTKEIIETADNFRVDMLRKLDEAKNNEILSAIRGLNTRLDAIEARLPENEDDR